MQLLFWGSFCASANANAKNKTLNIRLEKGHQNPSSFIKAKLRKQQGNLLEEREEIYNGVSSESFIVQLRKCFVSRPRKFLYIRYLRFFFLESYACVFVFIESYIEPLAGDFSSKYI